MFSLKNFVNFRKYRSQSHEDRNLYESEASSSISESKIDILKRRWYLVPVVLVVGGFTLVSVYSFWSWNKNTGTQKDWLGVTYTDGGADGEKDLSSTNSSKGVASPINGEFYTKSEAKVWQKRRPLAVMIENHVASRPPYGLQQAEIIYEAVAEGGITRFMAIYLAKDSERLEPIRSAREYFLHWASEFDALYTHWGGANSSDPRTDALGNIGRYGIADLECMRGGGLCWRDNDRYAPHNGVSNTETLWKKAEEWGLNKPVEFKNWLFKDELPVDERPQKQTIQFEFWGDSDFTVKWEYDPINNDYLRFNGDRATKKHVDANTNEQLRAKNVIIQEMTQNVVNDGTPYPHLVFETTGSGKAKVFLDGKLIEGTWKKDNRKSRTRFYDINEDEIEFNRGLIWVEVIPIGNVVLVT